MGLSSVLFVGFLLGIKHALESDHLAAVATLATGQQSIAATLRQGVAWGVGHTATLVVVGGVVVVFGQAIPLRLQQALELCVAVMLVLLGLDVVRKWVRGRVHIHVHRHGDGPAHLHFHSHALTPPMARPGLPRVGVTRLVDLPHFQLDHALSSHQHEHAHSVPLRAIAVGVMHGLAGSAALVLLSAQTAQSVTGGLGYIVTFGLGSILGMGLLSLTVAIPLRWSGRHLAGVYRGLTASIGIGTALLGGWMIYSIGFVDGLLVGLPVVDAAF